MKRKRRERVLIFGGAGFVGANLVRHILRVSNASITVVDSLDPRLGSTKKNLREVAKKIRFIKGDIRNPRLLKKVIPGKDIIYNCAAQTSHSLSLKDPFFDTEVNCIGALNILIAIREYNPNAIIVYPSSSTVIGRTTARVVDEHHAERPRDIYSANKAVAEKYHLIFHHVYGLKTVVLRLPNLYGPYGKTSSDFGFANYFIDLVRSGKSLTIYGDGKQTRNLLFVDDACDILWRAAHQPKLIGDVFFAVHDEHHSVRNFADAAVAVFGQGRVVSIPWPNFRKKIEVDNVLLTSARLHRITKWKATYSLAEGLQRTKEHIQEA